MLSLIDAGLQFIFMLLALASRNVAFSSNKLYNLGVFIYRDFLSLMLESSEASFQGHCVGCKTRYFS